MVTVETINKGNQGMHLIYSEKKYLQYQSAFITFPSWKIMDIIRPSKYSSSKVQHTNLKLSSFIHNSNRRDTFPRTGMLMLVNSQ